MIAPRSDAAAAAERARRREIASTAPVAVHPALVWVIAAAFVAAGLAVIQANTFLNDEGVLTWIFAGLTSEAPLDMLFFLKARPAISLLYAPVAALGLSPFLWVHLLVAAVAVPLTASLARRFDHHRPLLPAALLALSPLYFAAAAAGVQNTDGTVGLLLVAWLMSRNFPLTAGLFLGAVVLGRIEIAFFAVVLAAYAALTPGRRRLLLGAVAIPGLYFLAGTVYHGDLLWPLHYPSSVFSNPAIGAAERAGYGGSLRDLVSTALGLTPVVGALAWISLRGRGALENVLILAAIAFVLVIRVLPFTQLIYVDASPRYVLPALPFLCLGVGRVLESWGAKGRRAWAAPAMLLAVVALVSLGLEARTIVLLFAAAGICVLAAAVASRSRLRAAMIVLAGAAAGFLPLLPGTRLLLGERAQQLEQIRQWIAAAHVPRHTAVVTDRHLLGIWLAEYAPELGVEVRHLVTADMLYELKALTNPATHQLDAVFATSKFFYAPWILPEQVASLSGDTLFVMRNDGSGHNPVLSEPPFDRVRWRDQGAWIAGRLGRSPAATGDHPAGVHPGTTRPPAR